MANIDGIITEDIGETIAISQTAYDNDGRKVGTVDFVDRANGYVLIQTNPFASRDLYIPFSLITNIDPRELYLSLSRDELKSGYADPPARFTMIGSVGGKEAAITIEASGYGGSPVVVERSKIHKLKKRVAVGARVFTSDMVDLGTVSRYDPATGWMMIDNGGPFGGPNLLLPVTIVEDVDTDSQYVYLVFSQADLERRQHLEPANVIFVEAVAP